MRELVRNGYLGGKPVHMESIYCYDLSDERYAKSFLGDRGHWVRALPGSLLQNVISHGISKLAEFLHAESPKVVACGFTSPLLERINQNDIIDEVRVIIKDEDAVIMNFPKDLLKIPYRWFAPMVSVNKNKVRPRKFF